MNRKPGTDHVFGAWAWARKTWSVPGFLFLLFAQTASALNHETIVPPLSLGPNPVACSNVAQDSSRMAPGTVPADYWEGRTVNDQPLYIDQILSAPETAITFRAVPPNDRSIYPNTANTQIPFVALVCHPTTASNSDPSYALPGGIGVVPHMQPAGTAPKLAAGQKYPMVVYSHGLSGSPIGKGYVETIAALASHGFVVAAVFHADNRFSRVRVEDLSDFFYLLTQYDRVAEMMLMRPVSLKAMTDALLAHPQFGPAIDADHIAAFGASLGGQAVANLMGAKLTTSIGLACRETVRDPRIKVGVGFVPYSGQTFLPAFCEGQGGAAEVSRPYLAIAGTADTTAPLSRTRQAVGQFKGSRYLVELVDGQHELRTEDIGDLFTWMVTFYQSYLLGNTAAYQKFFAMRGVTGGRDDSVTIDVHVPTDFGPADLRVTELHNDRIDRYFLETNTSEVALMVGGSAGPGWNTTGYSFKAWSQPVVVPETSCHFDDGFFGGGRTYAACGYTRRLGQVYDESGGFFVDRPDANGRCPAGELIVNRLYNPALAFSRNVSSQRYVTSDSAAREMASAGWILLPATMCARF